MSAVTFPLRLLLLWPVHSDELGLQTHLISRIYFVDPLIVGVVFSRLLFSLHILRVFTQLFSWLASTFVPLWTKALYD